jgi:hypothetical protein
MLPAPLSVNLALLHDKNKTHLSIFGSILADDTGDYSIQFNYYLCAESTVTRPVTDTAQ